MLQFLKDPRGFPSAHINLNHRGGTQSRQNDAKAVSLLWVSQPKLNIFIKSQIFSNFFEAFGSEELQAAMLQFLKGPMGFPMLI